MTGLKPQSVLFHMVWCDNTVQNGQNSPNNFICANIMVRCSIMTNYIPKPVQSSTRSSRHTVHVHKMNSTEVQNPRCKLDDVFMPIIIGAFASKKREAQCTAVGKPENAMKRRKALLSEEELLVRKETDSKNTTGMPTCATL